MGSSPQQAGDPAPGDIPICAIGASAGGIVALQGLFRLLEPDLGLAYVVILHLSPDQPSALAEILSLASRMRVVAVTGRVTIERDHIYVIPPDRELRVDGDVVAAQPFSEPRGHRSPIDSFFASIAAGRGDGIAVVLSGAGADGALGIRRIKEAGGVVMVQEPADAGFSSMPQNAIATGAADFVVTIPAMAERIGELARSKEAVRSLDVEVSANELRRIIALLRSRIGHDFSNYKRATVLRRVRRRMQVCRADTLVAYLEHLRASPGEAKLLFTDLLISVTSFFRDPAAFEALRREVVVPLFDALPAGSDEGIRAWCVGCATGEEPYSLAMLLLEEAGRRKVSVPVQIFATDLDEDALARARAGCYPRTIEQAVTPERLARFFTDEGTHYRVRKELRDAMLFATHSLLREPPFMRLDLIVCRNLLIYLEQSTQKQVGRIFHYGLRPGRWLFLGSAETADVMSDLFAPLDRDARLYVAKPQAVAVYPMLPPTPILEHASAGHEVPAAPAASRTEWPSAMHAAALEAIAPPSALVDDGFNVLHLSPSSGRFILHPEGPLSSQLAAVVREELRLDLRLALTRAVEQRLPSLTHPVAVAFENGPRRVALQVLPVPAQGHLGIQVLVLFLDGGPVEDAAAAEVAAGQPEDRSRTARLHAELRAAQEALELSRKDHDGLVQELRAANEELQSINEEFRSTAEELETSKEELQSINEELHTVNAELKSKLEAISTAHADLENLITASEIGTLFLARDLRIRMFTPPIARLFNVTSLDIGRPIGDFTNSLRHDALERDLREAAAVPVPIEHEVMAADGSWYVMRLRPYRTGDNRIDGVVATFVDISARVAAEASLAQSETQFRNLVRASSQAIFRVSADWSELREMSGGGFLTDTDRPTRRWLDRYVPRDEQPKVDAAIRDAVGNGGIFLLEHRVIRADGTLGWTQSRAVPLVDRAGDVVEWFGAAADVTERQEAIEAIQQLNATLERQVAERTGDLTLFRNIVHSARSPICAYDTAQCVTAFNRAHAEAWWRMMGRETVLGDPLPDLFPPGQSDTQRAFAARALAGEEFQVRTRFGDPGRAPPDWEIDYAPVRDEAGAIIGAFHHARDITARLRTEADLAEAEDALRQSQKMEVVGQLTGGLAHDFNNLLTGVQGSLELLEARIREGRFDEAGRLVDAAQAASRRAASLTHRLLAFSRRQTLAPRPTDIERLVAGMEELVRRTVGPGIALERRSRPAAPWTIFVDPAQLETALLNLCVNARDAMPEGGTIAIEIENRTIPADPTAPDAEAAANPGGAEFPPGEYVRLTVRDEGVGMSPATIARAFEPFFTTKPIGRGTGLGLSMIYGFARQSGGDVRIRSEPGQGAAVSIWLPRSLDAAEPHEAAPTDPEPRGPAQAAGRGGAVLVVDDDATIRMLMVEVMREAGFRVREADDSQSGLAALEAGPVDLLITDVGLPGGMNGRQMAERARAARPGLRVLFVTGYADDAVLEGGDLGPDTALLAKPFGLREMMRTVRGLMAAGTALP